jgi:uncharacterized membrane protein YgdD (TMEM256/DUF423 family)
MDRIWIGLGALAGLLAVAMAAAAAHLALAPPALAMLREGVQMQGWHALALVATGLWAARGGRLAQLAGLAFTLGLLLFCGTVYALALGGPHVSLLAPAGGWLLMAGWALLGLSALRAR